MPAGLRPRCRVPAPRSSEPKQPSDAFIGFGETVHRSLNGWFMQRVDRDVYFLPNYRSLFECASIGTRDSSWKVDGKKQRL
jgi:hypothetical protein